MDGYAFMFVLLIAQGNWSNCSEKWRLETLEALSVKEKRRRGSRGEVERGREREKRKMQLKREDHPDGMP